MLSECFLPRSPCLFVTSTLTWFPALWSRKALSLNLQDLLYVSRNSSTHQESKVFPNFRLYAIPGRSLLWITLSSTWLINHTNSSCETIFLNVTHLVFTAGQWGAPWPCSHSGPLASRNHPGLNILRCPWSLSVPVSATCPLICLFVSDPRKAIRSCTTVCPILEFSFSVKPCGIDALWLIQLAMCQGLPSTPSFSTPPG